MPNTADQLRSFLGFAQYYAKFVPNFAGLARPLHDSLADSKRPWRWTNDLQRAYRNLLAALLDGKVLRSFNINDPIEVIVDASDSAIGGVLEQDGRPVVCVSRKLSPAEKNYAQVQKEALAIHLTVSHLHKYLYANRFKIVTDHKPLQYLLHPTASLGKSTSSMLQRWALHLSGYSYNICHRPGKQIAQADYLSRHSFQQEPDPTEEVLFTNPLPVNRNQLIQDTKQAYGPVLAALQRGWSMTARRRFPELYARRSELLLLGDGVITFNDRALIPPSCRLPLLQHLHAGHLGRDKMLSLARILAWWPSINQDIQLFLKQCEKCQRKPRTHPNWTPWPAPFQPMQRIHADYCWPFLGAYWALIVEDAYSKFPEVFITNRATADFTKKAFLQFFAREGIPLALVTDNGTDFTAEHLQTWLRSIGCSNVFAPPRHPASNGQAENFVKTLKTAIQAGEPTNLDELQSCINTFLLQYRNATHASTGKPPALLFKGRLLRVVGNLDTSEVTFFRGNNANPADGLVLGRIGNRLFNVMDREDGSVHRRHKDQIIFNVPKPQPQEPTTPTTATTPEGKGSTCRGCSAFGRRICPFLPNRTARHGANWSSGRGRWRIPGYR